MTPDTPTNAPESSGNALSVSEAAAVLRVSERTIRRKCEAGKMAARRVATPSGLSWQIDPEEVRTLRTGAAIAADTQNGAGTQNTPLAADAADKLRTGAAMSADKVLLDHVLEENRRLWLALEAAQQSEAVTKAALREALRGTKALPAPSPEGEMGQNGTENDGAQFGQVRTETGGRMAPQRARNIEVGSYGPKASDGAKIEEEGAKTGVSYGDIADELERLLSNGEN